MNQTVWFGELEPTTVQGSAGWYQPGNLPAVTTNGFEARLGSTSRTFDLYVQGNAYQQISISTAAASGSPSTSPASTFIEIAGRGWTVGQLEDVEMLEFVGQGTFWQVEGTPRVVEVTGRALRTPIEGFPDVTQFLGKVFTLGAGSGPTSWTSWYGPTTSEASTTSDLVAGVSTTPNVTNRRRRHRPGQPSRAFHTFKALAPELGMTDAQLAEIIEVGRTTVYNSWGRGSEPRPATARRLYELNATVDALLRRNQGNDLLSWLARGTPSPRELLEAHELEEFNRRADELIFRRQPPAEDIGVAWLTPDDGDEPTSREQGPRRRSAGVRSRRVTR